MAADKAARENMAYAQFLAGMAFNNASLGFVHAMAHQLGGFYDLPHGVCNAVLLPHVQSFNASVSAKRLSDVGRALGRTSRASPMKRAPKLPSPPFVAWPRTLKFRRACVSWVPVARIFRCWRPMR